MLELLFTSLFPSPGNIAFAEPLPPAVAQEVISIGTDVEEEISVVLKDEDYKGFRDYAAKFVGENTSDCAKFVNRMFYARFGELIFGNAWTLQIHPDNQKFLSLEWQIPEEDFDRGQLLRLKDRDLRIQHFEDLYAAIEKVENPVGVMGFVYKFSFYREEVAQHKNWLPQTHVAFLAGKKKFFFENTSERARSLKDVLIEQYGKIHDYEREFIASKVDLTRELQPGEKYFYEDYLMEEHFKKVVSGSLLEIFLRKHRNNRITPLLRPVSFSSVSGNLLK